jgi:hypothetical protein
MHTHPQHTRGYTRTHHTQVYVLGERGIIDELAAVGIASCGGPDDNDKKLDGREVEIDPEVRDCVLGDSWH